MTNWRRRISGFCVLALFAACRNNVPQPPIVNRPNVLLITVDTLRADHLPVYGYERLATPAISRLAREGVTFAAAYTPVPLTLPAHTSILTGLLPFRHGVRDNGGFYVNSHTSTLATILKSNGYQTAAFVSAFVLDSRWGLANGFARYFDNFKVSPGDLEAMGRVQRPGGETWAEAKAWLNEHVDDSFFLWLHLFDPHAPYAPPEPFRTQYTDRPYDGEIAYSDAIIGQAVDFLTRRGVLNKTLIVFLSDHGEGLGDHGEDEHGLLMYDSTLHVPWIMRLPSALHSGVVVKQPVSLVDVVPTVLGLLDISAPEHFDGTSRVGIINGNSTQRDVLYAETYYPRLRFNWSELVALRNDHYKFIRAPRPELYEYISDPSESHNVAAAHSEIIARFQSILNRLLTSQVNPAASSLDADTASRLAALGYIATGPADAGSSETLADPKDKTEVYRSLMSAREMLATGHDDDGIKTLQRLVFAEPTLEPARRLLREYWLEHRNVTEGLAWFTRASAHQPRSAPLLIELATFERAAGQSARALATFQRARSLSPSSTDAYVGAAEVLQDAGHYDAALDSLKKAAEQSPDLSIQMRLAETLIKVGRLTEASAVLRKVLATDAHAASAHYLLAQIAEAQHDLPRAEQEYRSEMSVSPWDYRAAFNLAALIGARDDHRDQVALLESVPRLAPQWGDGYIYLAKALLDLNDPTRISEAINAAQRGLQLAPQSPSAPLGHYVLSDIYNIQGRSGDARRELQVGRQLEQQLDRLSDNTKR